MTGAREDDRQEAAEYVLGTLDAAERSAARSRIARDNAFAALVTLWERRLGPLHELAVSVAPPEGLLQEIMAGLPAAETMPSVAEEAPERGADDAASSTAPSSPSSPPTAPAPASEAVAQSPRAPDAPPAAEGASAEEPSPIPPVVAEAEIRELEKDSGPQEAASARLPSPLPQKSGPSTPPAPPAPVPAARNPWRVASGLMAILVLGLGGLLLRDAGRSDGGSLQPPTAQTSAPQTPVAQNPAAQPGGAQTQHEAVLTPRSGLRVTIKLDPATRRLDVVGLPGPPPEGQTYRLWLVGPDGARHLLCAFRDPSALAPDFTAWTGQSTAMLEITLEAADGTPGQGTGEVILAGPLRRL
ncbi:anti-sigma factor [Roseixanthobacter glucoisosaccharinicivorans]|uniref:anti-sigma factor n=1 Tax=Roseixanthobacter glucoisosaccharinicivorans TaxID=3119923 RepID=UPI003728337A